MKSAFTLPALIAVAVHLVALFAFNSAPASPPHVGQDDPIGDTPPRIRIYLPPPEPPDEVIDVAPKPKDSPSEPPKPFDNQAPRTAQQVDLKPSRAEPFVPTTSPITQTMTSGSLVDGLAGIDSASSGWSDAVGFDYLDETPRPTLQVPPRFPDAMRREGRSAQVAVTFVVGRDGRVMRADAERGAPAEFAQAALAAVQRWRFEPGRRNGRPVSFRMTVPIVFNLSDSD